MIHVPSGELAATGLAMPHSPRWHDGKLWLLNSGTGELGWIEHGRSKSSATSQALYADSPLLQAVLWWAFQAALTQFTGLPSERLHAEGIRFTAARVVDLATGEIMHSLDLPEPVMNCLMWRYTLAPAPSPWSPR